MRTVVITRQTLHEGTEALVIYKTVEAYYVAHVNRQQHAMTLPGARYETYAAAEDRLQQEVRERSQLHG